MYIENIVIGEPLVHPAELLAENKEDWENVEKEKTFFTNETYLPKILVEISISNSVSQVRKNSPQLNITFDISKPDFFKIKISKKRFLYVIIGE